MIDSLDDVQESIEGWYDVTAKPFLQKHRNMVYDAALAEAEEKYGKLLETCDEGTKCREDIIAEIKANIKKIWKQVLVDFETTIEGSISETKHEVSVAWDHLITCGEEANCC